MDSASEAPATVVSHRRAAAATLLIVCAAWLVTAAAELFAVWLAQARTVTSMLPEAAGSVAVLFTVAAAVGQWRRGRPAWSVTVLVVSAVVATPVLTVDWTRVSVQAYYRFHHADFATVASYVRPDGGFIADAEPADFLPPAVRWMKVDATAAPTGGGTILILPVWADYPDVPGAFIHLTATAPAGTYDCYGSRCHFRWPLGDGWYWYERDPVSWAATRP
ncbi:Kef-type K+ transport system membrane component KefB [Catenuloplanes nepalensis]|uniref:Kef-type K+ transport system membrane component KefB n=1 Tax=Catenuloplanes nepalensis TaxID=587533 RepID=A0ABT9MSB3_9ACTN|nr:hypothetical protein [Catenuloplanes nepalensis]MDP9794333.1 Kef-type K+ transport system membrane component KefB [Catenuloplanes nepalensis]